MPNETESWQVSRRVQVDVVAGWMVGWGVIAEAERHIGSRRGVFDPGRYAYGENSGIVRRGATRGEVVRESDRHAGESLRAVFAAGCCGENGREGGDGGEIENTAGLDGRFVDGGDVEGGGGMGWRVREDVLG